MPTVTVYPDQEIVPAAPGESILEALFNSGYSYRIGCRRGGCAVCKVDLLSGEVTYSRTVCEAVLTDVEKAAGTVLSCRAVPASDITIALRDERVRLTNRMLRQVRLSQYEKAAGKFAAADIPEPQEIPESPRAGESQTKES
ncbi:MAG: 2Fe-2S iron-sulfur cluster-binding protein [Mobilicoccus sp.]|nr:2Fe-2S iron-sulfur cluster-binding protein [Mobilicoccus sp.]